MGGSIRLNVYMRVKVWINGSLRHNKNTRLAYNSSRYNKTYTHPSYSSGIPLSYTFPSYASSAKVKMQVSINLQDYDYRGSYAYGYFYSTAYIRGNNVISGELSRLG